MGQAHSFSGNKKAPQTAFQFSALLEKVLTCGPSDFHIDPVLGEVSVTRRREKAVLGLPCDSGTYWLQPGQDRLQD